MSTVPLLSSVPITVGGRTFDPKPDLCFSCTPPYKHRRAWVPEVHSQRTVVLCFDGTGDSFDKDVSQLPSPSHPGSYPILNGTLQNTNVVNFVATLKKDDPTTQLVYYQVICVTLRVKSTVLMSFSSGRYRYLHKHCTQDADRPDLIQNDGQNVCLGNVRPYQRSFLPSHPTVPQRLTNHSRRIHVFDAKLLVACTLDSLSLWKLIVSD